MDNWYEFQNIAEVMYLRDLLYAWVTTPGNEKHKDYWTFYGNYERLNKTVIDYYNSRNDRKAKIIVGLGGAAITGLIGLVGLGITAKIATSPMGAEFNNATRGIPGQFLKGLFR